MICRKCGLNKQTEEMVKRHSQNGAVVPVTLCNLCNRKKVAEWRKTHPDKAKESRSKHHRENCKGNPRYLAKRRIYMMTYRLTPEFHYMQLKYRCKELKTPCDISFDQYVELTKNPCFYCGGPLPKTGFGLDQIVPRGGYSLSNVRPCCDPCNTAKNDMTEAEFLELVDRISLNIRGKTCQRQ